MRECTQSHSERQTELGSQDGRRWEGATGPGSPSTKEEEWTQPGHSRRAEAPFSLTPTKAVGRTLRETQRSRGVPGGQNRQGKQQAQGQTTRGSDKGHTETPGGQAPPSPTRMQDTPERLLVRCRSRRSQPSSCCTLGRMMWGPWMPTSMPTTRPSRSTFGQWTLGERVEILDRTCWETSHTLQCGSWSWRARSPLWGAAPTAERGAFSDGSPNREARRR